MAKGYGQVPKEWIPTTKDSPFYENAAIVSTPFFSFTNAILNGFFYWFSAIYLPQNKPTDWIRWIMGLVNQNAH